MTLFCSSSVSGMLPPLNASTYFPIVLSLRFVFVAWSKLYAGMPVEPRIGPGSPPPAATASRSR